MEPVTPVRLNLRTSLAIGFALVIVLLIANAWVSYQNIRRIADNNASVTRTYEILGETQAVLSSMQDAETGQRGFIITGEESYLEPYNSGVSTVQQHLYRLDPLISAPSVRSLLPKLREEIDARLELLRRGITTRRSAGWESARKRVLTGEGKRRMDAIRGTIADMQGQQRRLLVEREAEAQASTRTALGTLGISSAATLALIATVMLVLRRDAGHQERAAAQIKVSGERFAALVTSTAQVVWTTSPEGEYVEDQPSWRAFTGASVEEILGAGWRAAIHPDDVAHASTVWARALATSGLYEVEYRLRRRDGVYRDMEVRGVPVRNGDGPIREWVGTCTDITEAKRAAAELHESEARNAAILATALDCIIAIDAESRIQEWNPAAERTFGHTRAEAIGRQLPELIIPPSLREAHRTGLDHYFKTGEGPVIGQRIEVPALHADGHEFPVELAVTRIEGGGSAMFSAYLRDITQQKQAAADLESHARLATLTAEIGLALTRSDDQSAILQSCAESVVHYLDAAVARIWTLNERDDVMELQGGAGDGRDPNVNDDRVRMGSRGVGQVFALKAPYHTDLLIGDPLWGDEEWVRRERLVSFAGYPLLVEGQLLGYVAMYGHHALSSDEVRALGSVADALALGVNRNRVEEDLAKAKEVAEEASRTKSLFLANMSHELRTPLNAILGYSEMLQEEATDQSLDEFVPDLEKINGAGRHLLSLINDILDLSKIEAGKMELYVEAFDASGLIDEVAATVRPLIAQNGNTLAIERSPELGTVRSDLTKVRQCLFNLLSNAAKFTKGGTITLNVDRERMESVDRAEPRDWLVFRVTDTGIGMSAEQILGLFQAFTQADASTTRKFGGTGLGLALTRRFSQMMGGDVTVSSVPGEGSTFTIKILADYDESTDTEPEDRPGLAPVPELPTTEPTATPGTCVLVIDDDPVQRDLMRRFLIKEGFPAETASTGEDGLRLARRLRPIAITLDVMMPGLDGWSVLAALKADEELCDIPVIMLTMVDDKKRGFAMGAVDYATKPVDRARLAQILQKYVCPNPPCSVLLVEDDDVTREMVNAMLSKDGWNVVQATNGREALEAVGQRRPDAILLDLMMPEMDGFEFAAALHRVEEWRSIPVIVLTAKDLTDEDRLRLHGYVQKILQKSGQPFEDLMRQVRDLVIACGVPHQSSSPPVEPTSPSRGSE